MKRRLPLLAMALTGAAVVAAFVVFGLASKGGSANPRQAPALPREHLVGGPVTVASLLASARGRSALVVFWASWCGPCAHEAPALQRFASGALGRGRVVGVDYSDGRAGAREFIARFRWTFPNVRDGEGTVGAAYELVDLPATFVLDARGRIRKMLLGPQDEASLGRALAAGEGA
jgi:cytochrome c biogenesis protein CcmG, thiol:disulfide interchange protein DsbE